MGEKTENTLRELMDAFSCEGRQVSAAEFNVFWKSCTDEQKAYYKSASLN